MRGKAYFCVEMDLERRCGCVGSTNFQKDPMLFHLQKCSIGWTVADLRIDNLLDKRGRRLSLDIIDISCKNTVVEAMSDRRELIIQMLDTQTV